MAHIILYAIVPIVVIMLLGFVSGKRGVFTGDDAKKFNKVVLDYALPAALFVSIAQASREMLYHDIKLTIVSTIVIMGCFMAVYFIYKYCFKENTGADAAVSALISGSPTIGFLGFAVLEPIFGTTPAVALVVAIVGIVVNAIGIPVGLSLLNESLAKQRPDAKKVSAWKPVIHALEQPVAWAPILAVIWVLVGIPWPAWASPSFDLIAKANASMAVFSAGITLASIKIVLNWQVFLGTILKLGLMPLATLVVGLITGMDPLNLKMLVVANSLPPAFSGIIIADEYDTYVATGTSSLTVSVIVFVFACPFWIWITDLCLKGGMSF
ncbi:MAG: permease [Desulfovibrio sp.]|nr:permease [Desulfovibrio sp.]